MIIPVKEVFMQYTRTAITLLTQNYKSVLMKCAILNTAMALGTIGFSGDVFAAETLVSDWAALKSNIETGRSVVFDGNITANNVDAIYSKDTIPEVIDLNLNILDVQVNQGYESYGLSHNSVFYFEGFAEGNKTKVKDGTIQNAINSTLYWQVNDSELEITNMNFINNYVTGQYTSRYGQGGALKLSSANKVTISNSIFTGNTVHSASAQSYGGAIESYVNNLIISDSTFNNNGIKDYLSRPQTTVQDGGAIMVASANSDFNTVTFISNKSTNSGGAIAYLPVYDISSTIKNSTFTGNETVNKGGAIYAKKSEITSSANIELTIENTDFTSNKSTGNSSKGGAIYASSDVTGLTVIDSSFRNNVASEGSAIYNESSVLTTIQANLKDVIFENNNSTGTTDGTGNGIYLTGSLNALASNDRTLAIIDTIKFADSNSMLNINTDFTKNYSGTVILDKAIEGGYGINLGGGVYGNVGTLKLGKTAANQTLSFLGAYGGSLDLRNENAGDVLTIKKLGANKNITNLSIDFDASSGTTDKLVINEFETGIDSVKFNLGGINVTKDGNANNGVFIESSESDKITLSQTPELTTLTSGGYKYTFTLDDQNFGIFNVAKESDLESPSLTKAITDSTINAYSIWQLEAVTKNLGTLAGHNRNFTIFGNTNDIIANSDHINGIIVNNGQILTINKVGNLSDVGSQGICGFNRAFGAAIDNAGKVIIIDSVFNKNEASSYTGGAIYNQNTVTITHSTFSENKAGSFGGAIYNYDTATITDSTFNGNEASYGGAIGNNGTLIITSSTFRGNKTAYVGGSVYNNGTATIIDSTFRENESVYGGALDNSAAAAIIAENKDVLFENNHAQFNGGAIYNRSEGTLNLNAKDNNSIIFNAATNNATNDIFNVGELNLNEGDIKILSAITDDITPLGTTNIGTKNTSATVIANAITQNTLNIQDGSSLVIDAGSLKIKNIINNDGIITLGNGMLTSAISGSGTTKIIGDVENTGETIAQEVRIERGSLTTSAKGLTGRIVNEVDGGLILNGGTLVQSIKGDGTTIIAGDIISDASISQTVRIQSGSLTTSATNLGNTVTNAVENGLILNGGMLTQAINGNGSTIISGNMLWGTGAKLGNVTIAQSGSLDIGTTDVSLDNMIINGTLKMTITDIEQDSSDYEGGKLIATDLTLGKESKLSLTVAPGLITEKDASTGELELIQVSGTSTGVFSQMLSNNRYEVSTSENGKFKITYTSSPTDIVNGNRGNSNNVQIAEAWEKIPTTGNAVIDAMQAHLNELSQHDSSGYIKALNNLAPTDSQAIARTTIDINNLISRQIEHHQNIQGVSGGDVFQNVGMWVEGLYNYSKQDNSSSNAGFTGKTAGFVFGLDGRIDEDITLGFGYAYNKTDVDTLERNIDVDGHTLFVYGKYQSGRWYTRGTAHYGFADYQEKADVNGSRNAADYNVQNIGLTAYAGYDLPNGLTPEGGLRFIHVSQDDYTDYAGQHISVDSNNILTLVAGAKYLKTFTSKSGIHWTPKARAALTYDIMSDDNKTNVNIVGINYDVNGEKLNRFGVEAGLAFEADINDWKFSVGYDAGIRDDYISHTGMLRLKHNF